MVLDNKGGWERMSYCSWGPGCPCHQAAKIAIFKPVYPELTGPCYCGEERYGVASQLRMGNVTLKTFGFEL